MNFRKLLPMLILPLIVSCGEAKSDNTSKTTGDNKTVETTPGGKTDTKTDDSQKTDDSAVTTPEQSDSGNTQDSGDDTVISEIGPGSDKESESEKESGSEQGGDSSKVDESTPFLMEAEYTNLDEKSGAGYSGGADGWAMIGEDIYDAGASNGYYVTYLYKNNLSLDFFFQSDKEVKGANLILRLTSEIKDVILTTDIYTITVNDVAVKFNQISLLGASTSDSEEYMRPFSNHTISNIDLKEGENSIKLITTNTEGMGGTMYATAPVVDCITIEKYGEATLSWNPRTDNLDHFE